MIHILFKLRQLLGTQICISAQFTIILSILIQVLNNGGQDILHFECVVIEALFDRLAHLLNILSQICDLLKIILLLRSMKSSNDVFNLLHILKTETPKVPVIHNKFEVVFNFDLVRNCSSVTESFTHNGDEHVRQMDKQDKC